MVGILLITHNELGACLIDCASHIVGGRPEQVASLAVRSGDDAALVLERARKLAASLDLGDGV
nr:PTS fructose transporter subunit IIA [Burkholderiales bacterium]